jgi:hypothetical protein
MEAFRYQRKRSSLAQFAILFPLKIPIMNPSKGARASRYSTEVARSQLRKSSRCSHTTKGGASPGRIPATVTMSPTSKGAGRKTIIVSKNRIR